MKLIIDIPDNIYDAIKEAQTIISGQRSGKTLLQILVNSVENGIPLDDVKAKIQRTITASWYNGENYKKNYRDGLNDAIEILDNIGKAESEK